MNLLNLRVVLAPLLPPVVLGALAALCLLVLLPALLRRAPGAGIRAAGFALALLFLAAPQRIIRTGTSLHRVAVLLVDRSASMQIGNRAALAEAAAARLEAQAARVPDLQLRRVDAGNDGTGTHLFAALDAALADIPPDQRAGVIAISDGTVTDAPRRFPLPLDVLIPARGEQTDRRLRVTLAPSYGIVGKDVSVGFTVEDLGAPQDGTATVRWSQDGADQGAMDVTVGQKASIAVHLGHAGPSTIALSVSPLAGEASILNNRVALTINGVRDRLRVLLISGEPHEGERTWRRLLKSDPSVDLVHFTILRPPGKDDFTPLNQLALIAFPIRELFVEKIRQFDLIILDRFSETGLLPPSYVENIATYVRQGGALLVSAGPEFADPDSVAAGPVGEVLPALPQGDDPVVVGAFRPEVTALGRRHPVTENLPGDNEGGTPHWGDWYRRLAIGPATGEVVMQAGPHGPPLLILNRVDQGRVALLLSDQIWLWARGHEGGGPQAELLRRVAHWLMKQPELDENALNARVSDGQLRIERHAVNPAPPDTAMTITDPDGRKTRLGFTTTPDGREIASVPAPIPGLWRADYGTQSAFAAAAPADPVEWSDLRATARLLRPIARSVYWLDPDGAPDLDRLPLLHSQPMRLTGLSQVPLLPAWAVLPVLLALLLAGWRREGR
jgi:hypothetical protein